MTANADIAVFPDSKSFDGIGAADRSSADNAVGGGGYVGPLVGGLKHETGLATRKMATDIAVSGKLKKHVVKDDP